MGIIDSFNEVGNNFAITSAGIGEALKRSASALFAGGNTLEESIGLITGANTVVQNPETVGTALKTLSLRIRGVKTELEEAGLETENMAETTSQLQAKLLALTHGKVDIMIDEDKFKSTYQILEDMSKVWKEMTDVEQAAALELIGGKRQANILASLIKSQKVSRNSIAICSVGKDKLRCSSSQSIQSTIIDFQYTITYASFFGSHSPIQSLLSLRSFEKAAIALASCGVSCSPVSTG
jgi:TP901 family phage tail tape measure protein